MSMLENAHTEILAYQWRRESKCECERQKGIVRENHILRAENDI